MTKFKVVHSCGHESLHGYSGSAAALQQRREWLGRQPCQTCWRRQQAEAAQRQTAAWELPALEGSEDELAWAEVIRTKAISHNRAFLEKMLALSKTDSGEDELCAVIASAAQSAMKELEGIRSAAWWVENRFEVLSYVHRATIAAAGPFLTPEGTEE